MTLDHRMYSSHPTRRASTRVNASVRTVETSFFDCDNDMQKVSRMLILKIRPGACSFCVARSGRQSEWRNRFHHPGTSAQARSSGGEGPVARGARHDNGKK